jgi:CspA family cold shock protein
MPRGVIKFFNDRRGYGFIESDTKGPIYVHHSAIRADGYKSLKEGEEVWFDVVEGQQGVEAVNVRKI